VEKLIHLPWMLGHVTTVIDLDRRRNPTMSEWILRS